MRARTIARTSVATLLIVGAAGCRVSDATAPLGPCTTPPTGLTVQLQSGQPTLFDWAPDCSLGGIIVETAGTTTTSGSDVWIVSDPRAHIAGPVSYGVTPPKASVVLAPTPLVAGQRYRVHLIGANGTDLYASDFTQQ